MLHCIVSLLVAGVSFVGPSVLPPSTSTDATPAAAMASGPSLTVTSSSGDLVDLGGGRFRSTLYSQGVIANGTNTATAIALSCILDHGEQTVQCAGQVSRNGSSAAIGLQYQDGEAGYRIEASASNALRVAWDLWYVDELVSVFPPIDDNGDPDTSWGSILTGSGPGAIIVAGAWALILYQSDWLLYVDGALMNPPD
ncbi:MAG: hypothetical protein IAG13_38605 [Deltaproteobacteria bacterium]|nr:hypothetical protein [Nannocystaceae bacterium]